MEAQSPARRSPLATPGAARCQLPMGRCRAHTSLTLACALRLWRASNTIRDTEYIYSSAQSPLIEIVVAHSLGTRGQSQNASPLIVVHSLTAHSTHRTVVFLHPGSVISAHSGSVSMDSACRMQQPISRNETHGRARMSRAQKSSVTTVSNVLSRWATCSRRRP